MIDVAELVKSHGATRVLCGASVSVSRGEVAAIIGPSGSGKSTFLRCLNGLESFESGSVTIDGLRFERASRLRDWPKVHRQICLRVGMVFQSFNLFPHRTAIQNVMEAPIHVLGLSRAAAEERARRPAGSRWSFRPAARLAARAFRGPAAAGGDCTCAGDAAAA